MFERFDEDALKAFVAAQEHARTLEHRELGPTHLLLGVLHEEWFTSAQVIGRLGFSTSDIRDAVMAVLLPGVGGIRGGHIPLDASMIQTLKLSAKEAKRLRDDRVGTEHLLLGVLREDRSRAARVVDGIGIDYRSTLNALKEFRSEA
jgi:ATP-dependent Clp protease ATP-binding subunit ClpA